MARWVIPTGGYGQSRRADHPSRSRAGTRHRVRSAATDRPVCMPCSTAVRYIGSVQTAQKHPMRTRLRISGIATLRIYLAPTTAARPTAPPDLGRGVCRDRDDNAARRPLTTGPGVPRVGRATCRVGHPMVWGVQPFPHRGARILAAASRSTPGYQSAVDGDNGGHTRGPGAGHSAESRQRHLAHRLSAQGGCRSETGKQPRAGSIFARPPICHPARWPRSSSAESQTEETAPDQQLREAGDVANIARAHCAGVASGPWRG